MPDEPETSKPPLAEIETSKPLINSPSPKERHPLALLKGVVADLFRFRELIWLLCLRDLKAEFRLSYFGYLWLLLPPLLTTTVWVFLNRANVVNVADTGMPYPVFVIIGSVIWQTFVRLLQMPLSTFDAGKSVFTRLKVPPEVFIAAGTLRAIGDFCLYVIVLLPVLIYFGITPVLTSVLFAAVMVTLIAMGTAIGLVLVPVSSLYSDLKHAIPIAMGFLIFLVPVIYPPPTSGGFASLVRYNPMTPLLMGSRDLLVTGQTDHWLAIALIFAGSIGLIAVGLVALRLVTPHLVVRAGM